MVGPSNVTPHTEDSSHMRRLIWLPIAGFLLVAGAAIAAAASTPTITPVAQSNQDAASPAASAAAGPSTNLGHGFMGAGTNLLDQVLADLVKAGTITQAQSDAITQGLQQAITDQQTQEQQQRQALEQEWTQIQGFLQDGVITQDEVNQLPADSPFRQIFNSIANSGQITLQQLEQLRMFGGPGGPGFDGPGFGGPGGRGHGFGPGWGPGGPDSDGGTTTPQASPSTTGTSS